MKLIHCPKLIEPLNKDLCKTALEYSCYCGYSTTSTIDMYLHIASHAMAERKK